MMHHGCGFSYARKWIAAGLCYVWPVSFVAAQEVSIEPVRPSSSIFWRPYVAPEVPPIRLANSKRLGDLMRAGKLYLTAQDAVALALENNIDVEVSRYDPLSMAWRVQRAQAGGALPGVPSGSSQASSVASGQGVLGSQASAGVAGGANGGSAASGGNASISQIGPVTANLDPSFQETTAFSHRSLPQPNVTASFTPVLVTNQRIYTGALTEGFLTGGGVSVNYNSHYLNENAPSDVLNPSVAPTLSVSFQHNLLQGFGVAVNARFITVAKINLQTSDLNFKTQIIGTAVSVLSAYYALVADYEDVKARQSALEAARQFSTDSKRQVQIGTLVDIDLLRAESQVAISQQNLVASQTNLQRDERQLKNLISRTGVADPVLASAQIVPLDRIVIPDNDDLPPMRDLVRTALAHRSDLLAETANVTTAEVLASGTRNGVLPLLVAFGGESHAGLAGTPRTVVNPNGSVEKPDPYFIGGTGTALSQIFRRNFPTENVGVFFRAEVHNRQAQADEGIDQLSLRQTQLATQKDLKQAEVDIMNSVIALRQARARYEAAVKNRVLAKELLDAEQKRFNLGASTPYNVVQQQRDLAVAQSTEIAAMVAYSNARVSLDQMTGTTLEANHVSIADARAGKVAQSSVLPADSP